MTTSYESMLYEGAAVELPEVPEAIAHLIRPEDVAATRKQALAEGKRFYIGKPDKYGCPYRYASCGAGVLETLHRNREDVASGTKAEAARRYYAANTEVCREKAKEHQRRHYATAEGYATQVVEHARAHADKLGVERRPIDEELVLMDVARFAFSLRQLTGMRLECHHAIRGVAEGGKHAYSNLVILSASTHHSLHATARWSHIHPAVLFRRALKAGEIIHIGNYFVEASVMKKASNALLRGCFGSEPPVLYDDSLPVIRPAGVPVDDGLPLNEQTLAAAVEVLFGTPANQNEKPATVPAAA